MNGRIRGLKVLERTLLCAGVCLLCWPLFVAVDSAWAQRSGERQLAAAKTETIIARKGAVSKTRQKPGSVVGRFEAPRLGLSYVILEGTAARTLDRSVGRIEGTGMPGETGNIGIAGHRNTHFRKLEWIRRDDDIILTSPQGKFRYKVEWVRLVTPAELAVLDGSHGPAVTLVTCFPFEYVGSAPMRMIVRALPDEETKRRLSPGPATGD